MSTYLSAKKQFKEAINYYQLAARIRPGDPKVYQRIGQAMVKQGEPDNALKQYHKARQLTPDPASIYYDMGIVKFYMGDLKAAIAALQSSKKLDPEKHETRLMLFSVLRVQTHINEAVTKFTKTMDLIQNRSQLTKHLDLMLVQKFALDEVISRYQKVIPKKIRKASDISHMKKVYNTKQKYADMLPLFKTLVHSSLDNPAVYYHVACIYAIKGMVRTSTRYLNMAIDKGFNDWEILKKDIDLMAVKNI